MQIVSMRHVETEGVLLARGSESEGPERRTRSAHRGDPRTRATSRRQGPISPADGRLLPTRGGSAHLSGHTQEGPASSTSQEVALSSAGLRDLPAYPIGARRSEGSSGWSHSDTVSRIRGDAARFNEVVASPRSVRMWLHCHRVSRGVHGMVVCPRASINPNPTVVGQSDAARLRAAFC